MGCDIHIHAEVKIAGKWKHYDQPRAKRNYRLFEKMAGVRGDVVKAIAPPRGIPEDATEMTKFHWDGDGHSHSWLDSKELLALREWWDHQDYSFNDDQWDQWLFGNHYSDFQKYPDERTEGVEDVRFIFWFDN